MGNLRDQLKKANLISKKDAKRLAHEQRVRRKEVGREGLEAEEKVRRDQLEKARAAEREQDRDREAERAAERKQREEIAACSEILRSEVRDPDRRGNMRWFFETESGHLPWMAIDHATQAQLASGALCVVRRGPADTHTYGLLDTDLARRVHRAFPDRIAWSAPGTLD